MGTVRNAADPGPVPRTVELLTLCGAFLLCLGCPRPLRLRCPGLNQELWGSEQAETVLLIRTFTSERGAGIKGLCGKQGRMLGKGGGAEV